jgi:acetyl-CoA acyltransferase
MTEDNKMKEAVIVAACRTAGGKAPRGTLKDTRPEKMGCTVLNELLKRAGNLDPAQVDDVVIGTSFPEHTQGMNLGRILVLSAGWPDTIPGMTVNRFCASGLQSIAIAAEKIMCGYGEVMVAGGVESMSQIPMTGISCFPNPDLVEQRPSGYSGMGQTAENVARRENILRERQDEFAVKSHAKAAAAQEAGRFKEQIVPVMAKKQRRLSNGRFELVEVPFDTDEGIRADTNMDTLASLRPAFSPDGSVTAGNSSQMTDGAAGVLLMSKEKAKALGLEPLATFRSFAVAGVNPEFMGLGPVKAIPKALDYAGLELRQIELIELNEAFAAQAIPCIDQLGLSEEITNVNGGAIALGHPLGCTGSKLTTQLVYELHARKQRFGMVSMCIGLGMGAAGIFEVEEY